MPPNDLNPLIADRITQESKDSKEKSDMLSNYDYFFVKVTEKLADKVTGLLNRSNEGRVSDRT